MASESEGSEPPKASSASPPPPGASPGPLVIGKSFIKTYYKCLSSTPKSIHKFYKQTSVLSHGLEATVPARPVLLRDFLESTDGGRSSSVKDGLFDWAVPPPDRPDEVVRFDFNRGAIDAQESVGGGILLVVSGHMTLPEDDAARPARPFVHTFFLNNSSPAGKKKNFYVHNDVLRFLAEETPDSAGALPSGVVSPPKAISPMPPAAPEPAPEVKPEPIVKEVQSEPVVVAVQEPAPVPVPPPQDKPMPPPPPPTPAEPELEPEPEPAAEESKEAEEDLEPAVEETKEAEGAAAEETKDEPIAEATVEEAKEEDKAEDKKDASPSDRARPGGDRRRQKHRGSRGARGGRGGSRSSSPASKHHVASEAEKAAAEKAAAAATTAAAPAPAASPSKPKAPSSWASLVVSGGSGGSVPPSPARSSAPAAPVPLGEAVEEAIKKDQQLEESKEKKVEIVVDEQEQKKTSTATTAAPTPTTAAQPTGGPKPMGRPPQRSPEATLFIKNVPDRTSQTDIRNMFDKYGNVISITLVAQRGFCFVDYDSPAAVDAVLRDRDNPLPPSSASTPPEPGRGGAGGPFVVHGRALDVGRKVPDNRRGSGGPHDGRMHRGFHHHRHRSASPGNGLHKGGGGRGGPRRPSPRGSGRERRDGGRGPGPGGR